MSVSRVMTQSPWQQPDLQRCTIVSCLLRDLYQPNQNSPCHEPWFSLTGDPVCLDRHMRLRYDCRGRASCYRTNQPLFHPLFPAKKIIIISLNWGTLILLLKTIACFLFFVYFCVHFFVYFFVHNTVVNYVNNQTPSVHQWQYLWWIKQRKNKYVLIPCQVRNPHYMVLNFFFTFNDTMSNNITIK